MQCQFFPTICSPDWKTILKGLQFMALDLDPEFWIIWLYSYTYCNYVISIWSSPISALPRCCQITFFFQDAMRYFARGATHVKTWPRRYLAGSRRRLLSLYKHPAALQWYCKNGKYSIALQDYTSQTLLIRKAGNQRNIWFSLVVLWDSGWSIIPYYIYHFLRCQNVKIMLNPTFHFVSSSKKL